MSYAQGVYSVAAAWKDAFWKTAVDMFAPDKNVLVSYGHPGTASANDIIAFMGFRTTQDYATMTASNRSREETLELDVMISCYSAGEQFDDKVPTDRSVLLLGQLEQYARGGGGQGDTTFGGVVRNSALTSYTSEGATDPQVLAGGRLIEIIATFTAQARITN